MIVGLVAPASFFFLNCRYQTTLYVGNKAVCNKGEGEDDQQTSEAVSWRAKCGVMRLGGAL